MGFVLVISLPFIFFSILLGFGCYFLGKNKGREEMRTGVGAQVYGTPRPPPGVGAPPPGPAPEPFAAKKEGPENLV
ncbi:hypothetical protein E2562_033068 [Oryza meyeriana var. granulata]|uniref:Uncharacterized protein n=1 Tax=Oryza meyeriana var. granulata TaxID=110450 RepID=A0A6G1DQU3_9ORYZ|nr:hypothetical protein E2562_033068 [Oryza meyeriana var. granulata]